MAVTFLHTGDLHLGSPLRAISGADEDLGERLARATQESFRRVVTAALERDVDFVVVAGDLYDREARSVRATEFLVEQFERLDDAAVPCYVVHGNHDPLGSGAESLDLPANAHVFGSEDVEHVHYPDDDDPEARIFGQSYGARHESNKLYYHYAPPDGAVPNVGVLHTGLDPDGRRYAPCSPSDLASKEIDYWALGHVHAAGAVAGAPAAYCGIPQGRHVEESGVGGCLLVELEAGAEPDVEFLPTSPIVWHRATVDVGGAAASGTGEPATNDGPAPDCEPAAAGAPVPDGARATDGAPKNLTDLEAVLEERALDLQEADATAFVEHDLPIADHDWEPEGFVCRWVLTGRGEVHSVVNDDPEARATLSDRLRSRLDGTAPFVWTECVRDRTGPPVPDRETLAEEDDVVAELCSLTEELRTQASVREELRDRTGEVWEPVEDPDREDVPPDRLPLSDDRLDDLVDRALETALNELAVRRNHVD